MGTSVVPLSTSFFFSMLASLGGCSSPPPAEEPKPETSAPASVPVEEPKAEPKLLPTFSAAQQDQLDILGPVCTTAYHLDANGQVDQIGCTGTEPNAAPVAAEKLSPYGQSWRGHFATATSDDLLVWFTSGNFMLSTQKNGQPVTVATHYIVGEADCVKLSGPGAPDALACTGSYPGLGHSVPDLLKVLTFGLRATKDGLPAIAPLPIFSAHSAENLWEGLCSDSLSVAYIVRSISVERNPKTSADDLKVEIERQGWLTMEMPAAMKRKESIEICKKLEQAMTEGSEPPVLSAAPSKLFSVVLPFGSFEAPAMTEIEEEASNEMAQSDERGRSRGLAR